MSVQVGGGLGDDATVEVRNEDLVGLLAWSSLGAAVVRKLLRIGHDGTDHVVAVGCAITRWASQWERQMIGFPERMIPRTPLSSVRSCGRRGREIVVVGEAELRMDRNWRAFGWRCRLRGLVRPSSGRCAVGRGRCRCTCSLRHFRAWWARRRLSSRQFLVADLDVDGAESARADEGGWRGGLGGRFLREVWRIFFDPSGIERASFVLGFDEAPVVGVDPRAWPRRAGVGLGLGL